jgi:hypothetical protein
MQATIERAMQSYTMIVNLNPDEERAARQKPPILPESPKATNRHLRSKVCDILEALENRIRDQDERHF